MPSPVSPATSASPRSPRVSFIIPLYNCLGLTQAMLASLQASLPGDLTHEIIFVDDGSTDGTRAWLATLPPEIQVVLNEKNLGYAAANNRGAAIAHGEFLALLNSDLILSPGWIEPMLEANHRLGAQAGVIGNVQRAVRTGAIDHAGIFFNHKGKPEHLREAPPPWWSRLVAPTRVVEAVTGACTLIDASLWRELGGFDEGYANGCEDVDLCFRALAAGRCNVVALSSVVQHHVSASPNRKRRDEENTYRLTRRWQRELVQRSVRSWCRHYYETCSLTPRDPEYALAWRLWLHAAGFTSVPPPEAVAATTQAIEVELERWRKMFG